MLKNKLNKNAKKIDTFIKNYINKQGLSTLISPMKYGVLSGGKKIRSSIILSTGKLYNLQKTTSSFGYDFNPKRKNINRELNKLLDQCKGKKEYTIYYRSL